MKLLIATPLYPPEAGGPATYAKLLFEGLPEKGIEVTLVKFSDVRHLPKVIRHIAYFWRVYRVLRKSDAVITFDTWSTGIPTYLAAYVLQKKYIVRVGGDFLWETYIERTGSSMRLSDFYKTKKQFSLREKLIYRGTRWLMHRVTYIVFNTEWQRALWVEAYTIPLAHTQVIENLFPEKKEMTPEKRKVFVAAHRPMRLKNSAVLTSAFSKAKQRFPDISLDTQLLAPEEHQQRIKDAYAVIIPSISEVNSNSAIDGLRYGKPFISPKDTGAYNRFKDVGLFVDTLDEGAIQEAIEGLCDVRVYSELQQRIQSFRYSHSRNEIFDEFVRVIQ